MDSQVIVMMVLVTMAMTMIFAMTMTMEVVVTMILSMVETFQRVFLNPFPPSGDAADGVAALKAAGFASAYALFLASPPKAIRNPCPKM